MKAYKAFNSDWTCRDFQYEIGKTYEMDGDIEVCAKGFHFCRELKNCYYFYSFCEFPKIAEVEILGNIDGNDIKGCTNKIKIIREIPFDEQLEIMNIDKDVWEKFLGFYQMTKDLNRVGLLSGGWYAGAYYGPFGWAVAYASSDSAYNIGGFIDNNTFLLKIWNSGLIATIDPSILSQKEQLYNLKLPTDITTFLMNFLNKYYP